MNKLFLIVFGAFALCSCTVSVHTVYDKSIDFTKYKTYCWMNGCEFKFEGPNYLKDSLLRENLKASIIEELKRKGLSLDPGNPDLLVGITVTVKDEKAIIYHHTEDQPFYRPMENNNNDVVTYLKGTLVLGMADRRESKIVWESFAVNYMEIEPDFSEKRIHKGIQLVLKNYPPKK